MMVINTLGLSYTIGCTAKTTISTAFRLLILNLATKFTAMLYKMRLGQSVTTIPTVGFNVETVKYKKMKFCIWVSNYM